MIEELFNLYLTNQFFSFSFVDNSRKKNQAQEIIYLDCIIRWIITPQAHKLHLINVNTQSINIHTIISNSNNTGEILD